MKKLCLMATITVIALAIGLSALAEETKIITQDKSQARINLAKKTGGFMLGLASGFLFHEAGHEIVARIENVDMNWNRDGFDLRWTAKNSSPEKIRNITWAGFGAQAISTEVILGIDTIPKNNAYVLGWLSYNIINSIVYPLRNELQSGGYGDLNALRENGVDTGIVEAVLI